MYTSRPISDSIVALFNLSQIEALLIRVTVPLGFMLMYLVLKL